VEVGAGRNAVPSVAVRDRDLVDAAAGGMTSVGCAFSGGAGAATYILRRSCRL
jgi:hypothetical protein